MSLSWLDSDVRPAVPACLILVVPRCCVLAHIQISYLGKYFEEHYECQLAMLVRSKQVPKTHLI